MDRSGSGASGRGRGMQGTFFSEAASVPAGTSLGSVALKTLGNRGSPGGGHPLLLVLCVS